MSDADADAGNEASTSSGLATLRPNGILKRTGDGPSDGGSIGEKNRRGWYTGGGDSSVFGGSSSSSSSSIGRCDHAATLQRSLPWFPRASEGGSLLSGALGETPRSSGARTVKAIVFSQFLEHIALLEAQVNDVGSAWIPPPLPSRGCAFGGGTGALLVSLPHLRGC